MLHRSIGDDLFQGVEPLVKPRAEQADRPVAAEHHALGAERLEELTQARLEITVGRELSREPEERRHLHMAIRNRSK